MRLKYKDIVIMVFLGGVLIYAACRRTSLLPLREGHPQESAATGGFYWQDTIRHDQLHIIAHPQEGIKVCRLNGEELPGHPDLKPEALHLETGFVSGGDTLDLIYCLTAEKGKYPCFRITADGTLAVVEI